jgi:hypothetical protein
LEKPQSFLRLATLSTLGHGLLELLSSDFVVLFFEGDFSQSQGSSGVARVELGRSLES